MFVCSETIDRWIEVHTACEVCVGPLRERRLLLEVFLHLGEVLMLHELVEASVRRAEVILAIVVHCRFKRSSFMRGFCYLGRILATIRD